MPSTARATMSRNSALVPRQACLLPLLQQRSIPVKIHLAEASPPMGPMQSSPTITDRVCLFIAWGRAASWRRVAPRPSRFPGSRPPSWCAKVHSVRSSLTSVSVAVLAVVLIMTSFTFSQSARSGVGSSTFGVVEPAAVTDPKKITAKPDADVEQGEESLSLQRLYMTRQVGGTAWSP